ncbi:hypothetical protein MUK42_32536, partial [Musa troglodytarum]
SNFETLPVKLNYWEAATGTWQRHGCKNYVEDVPSVSSEQYGAVSNIIMWINTKTFCKNS